MSSVERVRQVRMTCGTKARVVQNPAARPKSVVDIRHRRFFSETSE
jgi:hypothetical protein